MMNLKEKAYNLIIEHGPSLIGAILIVLVGLIVVKGIERILKRALSKSKLDVSIHSFIKSLTVIALKIIVVITALAMLGVQTTTFIAVLSAAGLAIGLALKDSLSNFAGGILLLTFRPFSVGDFIETQGYMGTVKEVQLLYTYINTIDNRRVMIPNGELANAKIINYSIEENRRVDLVFGVSYEDDIIKVKEVLNTIIKNHPLIIMEPEPLVRVIEHADSSINFTVKVWCKKENYWDIYYDLNEQVKITFDQEGISIPFPQNDIHLYHKSKELV